MAWALPKPATTTRHWFGLCGSQWERSIAVISVPPQGTSRYCTHSPSFGTNALTNPLKLAVRKISWLTPFNGGRKRMEETAAFSSCLAISLPVSLLWT